MKYERKFTPKQTHRNKSTQTEVLGLRVWNVYFYLRQQSHLCCTWSVSHQEKLIELLSSENSRYQLHTLIRCESTTGWCHCAECLWCWSLTARPLTLTPAVSLNSYSDCKISIWKLSEQIKCFSTQALYFNHRINILMENIVYVRRGTQSEGSRNYFLIITERCV